MTLGQAAADRARRRAGPDAAVVVLNPVRGAALGAALYAHRLAAGLPTYWDHLPQLEINAIAQGRPAFVPLVPKAARVQGGEAFEHRIEEEYIVAAGSQKLSLYLAKQDETFLRESELDLPQYSPRDEKVSVIVRQTPAQGHAEVEIWPHRRGAFGQMQLLLDWEAMRQTEKSREDVVNSMVGNLSFPDIAPQRAHWVLWDLQDTTALIDEFLRLMVLVDPPAPPYLNVVKRLVSIFRGKHSPSYLTGGMLPDRDRYSLVSSDGTLPDHIGSEQGGKAAARLAQDKFSAMIERAAADLAYLAAHPQRRKEPYKTVLRQLFLLTTWTYAAAPEPTIAYIRRLLEEKELLTSSYHVQAIGRTLTSHDDLKAYFGYAARRLTTTVGTYHWVKGVALALRFREDAPLARNCSPPTPPDRGGERPA